MYDSWHDDYCTESINNGNVTPIFTAQIVGYNRFALAQTIVDRPNTRANPARLSSVTAREKVETKNTTETNNKC